MGDRSASSGGNKGSAKVPPINLNGLIWKPETPLEKPNWENGSMPDVTLKLRKRWNLFPVVFTVGGDFNAKELTKTPKFYWDCYDSILHGKIELNDKKKIVKISRDFELDPASHTGVAVAAFYNYEKRDFQMGFNISQGLTMTKTANERGINLDMTKKVPGAVLKSTGLSGLFKNAEVRAQGSVELPTVTFGGSETDKDEEQFLASCLTFKVDNLDVELTV